MKSVCAKQVLDKIDLAILNINSFSNLSALEESYLAKFLVVFICGIYEEAIEIIINEKIARCNIPEATRYVSHNLERHFQNPKIQRIKALLSEFNTNWEKTIKVLSSQAKLALDSIVENKNNLAHGLSSNITLSEIIRYYNDSKIVIETIDNIVL